MFVQPNLRRPEAGPVVLVLFASLLALMVLCVCSAFGQWSGGICVASSAMMLAPVQQQPKAAAKVDGWYQRPGSDDDQWDYYRHNTHVWSYSRTTGAVLPMLADGAWGSQKPPALPYKATAGYKAPQCSCGDDCRCNPKSAPPPEVVVPKADASVFSGIPWYAWIAAIYCGLRLLPQRKAEAK